MSVFKSQPVSFQLGNAMGYISIFIHQIWPHSPDRVGWVFWGVCVLNETSGAHLCFYQKGNKSLELNEPDTGPKGGNHDFKGTSKEETHLETD